MGLKHALKTWTRMALSELLEWHCLSSAGSVFHRAEAATLKQLTLYVSNLPYLSSSFCVVLLAAGCQMVSQDSYSQGVGIHVGLWVTNKQHSSMIMDYFIK